MNWFTNMKIRSKLLSSFIIVALLAGLIGYIGISRIKQIDGADTKLYERMTVPLGQLVDLVTSFERIRINVRDAVLAENAAERNEYYNRIDELSKSFNDNLKVIESTILTDEGKKQVADITNSFNDYVKSIPEIKSNLASDNKTGALAIMKGKMKQDNIVCQKAIDDLQSSKLKLAKQASVENASLANEATSFMTIFMLIVLIASIVLGLIISGNIQSIIKSVVKQSKDLIAAD